MPREISDEEYQFLQGKRVTADFVESIYNDPSLNKEAKRLIKRKYPNLSIPDYDLEEKVDARFAAEKKAKDDAEESARLKAEDEKWKSSRSKVQKDYGFTDEGMKDLDQWMKDHYVGDYEVAASYRAAKNPKPSDAAYSDQFWHHEKAPGFAEIARDPEGWGRSEILGAIRRGQDRMRQG